MKGKAGDIIDVTDQHLFSQIGNHVVVGKSFAFIKPETFRTRGFGWLYSMFGVAPATTTVVPLLGWIPIELPGVVVEPRSLSTLRLRSLTTDKMVYRLGEESINLFAFEPQNAGKPCRIRIISNGADHSSHVVKLGKNGEGSLLLRDLTAGDYSATFDDEIDVTNYCNFTVAEYRLVPLVATIIDKEFHQNGTLKATLKVESFGVGVNGDIRVEVIDGAQRTENTVVKCEGGVAHVRVTLVGVGPHQLALQLVQDPSKTASVAIVGSREKERRVTVFNPLGTEILGSLLPAPDSTEVRGIYMTEGAARSTPIALSKIENGIATFEMRSDMENVTLCILDPNHPKALPNAIDVSKAPHPVHEKSAAGQNYIKAEKLYFDGKIADALAIFEEFSGDDATPVHPNFQYYVACCHARLGDIPAALQALRRAIEHGWTDYRHLDGDADLAILHGLPEFEVLRKGGMRIFSQAVAKAGEEIRIEVFKPACIVAIGGLLENYPWEGWTAAVSPVEMSAELDAKEVYKPSEKAEFRFKNVPDGATVYCIVKDARLISSDTNTSRLASAIKTYVEKSGSELVVGIPKNTLKQMTASGAFDGALFGMLGMSDGLMPAFGGGMPVSMAPPAASTWDAAGAQILTRSTPFRQPETGTREGVRNFIGHNAVRNRTHSQSEGESLMRWDSAGSKAAQPDGTTATIAKEKEPAADLADDRAARLEKEPEVLYAGFLEARHGEALLSLKLPDALANFTIEAFIADRYDWNTLSQNFRTDKQSFVELTLPVFSTAQDNVRGRLFARSETAGSCISVTCDGHPVELFDNDGKTSVEVKLTDTTKMHAFSFIAKPGSYEARLVSGSGKVTAAQCKQVQIPGKLKHEVKSLRMLEAGDQLAFADVPGLRRISILPGIDSTFNVMVEATANYSHCCCQQTATKILAGCAMYMLVGEGDDGTRKKAEAIIVAGIKREERMWVPGKGLMAYPPSEYGSSETNSWLGQAAASELWNLSSLKTYGEQRPLGPTLQSAVDRGLEIARDVSAATGMVWPPRSCTTAAEAYYITRYSESLELRQQALKFVRDLVLRNKFDNLAENRTQSWMGAGVYRRMEAAYAACVLLTSKEVPDIRHAVQLANMVVSEINSAGRLYSTVDSAAAIALMAALKTSAVGSAGKLEVNGVVYSTAEAVALTEEIRSVKALEGVISAQIARTVEEDWAQFSCNADISVSLQKGGSVQKKFEATDQIDLKVKIGGGYKDGDILWICLPDAIARIYGGAQIKMFSVDFAGADEMVIPLAATSATADIEGKIVPQKIACCLRNMFDEDRVGNPGLISVTVEPFGAQDPQGT